MHQPTHSRFPPGFLWGAASAAHQVEGGNVWNDWWEYEQRGSVPHRSEAACRHYELFARDFDLARSLGQNAHRFSIEWSRIEPQEGTWSRDAITHYADVIHALTERGLEPVVTLHHFTNPAWFLRRGGWSRRDSPAFFARYVEEIARELGPRVRYWLTINEPTVYVMQGYILGEWPPCQTSAWATAGRVLRNLARAHTAAYRVLHAHQPQARVGFAHSAPVIRACDPRRLRDRFAAACRDAILNHAFFHLIGTRSAPVRRTANLDFLGLNYYTRNVVRSSGWGLGALVGRACREPHHGGDGPISTTGWEVYPAGLRTTLEDFSRYGVPMIVTENGVATDDDELRRKYLADHLTVLSEAIHAGLEVFGYLHWSLIDNFEWALGTTARFGLAAVDYVTQERTVRPSARYFERVCRENSLPPDGG